MPFGFHFAVDTLPSRDLQGCGFRSTLAVSGFRLRARLGFSIPVSFLWPARHYPRVRIPRSSFERRRDFNPHEQYAAQHTLRRIPTPPSRACPASAFRLPGPDCSTQPQRRSPGSRAYGFPACWALRLRGTPLSLAFTAAQMLPSPSDNRVGIPNKFFGALSPSPSFPLFTLRSLPHDNQRKTRGQNGSLFLSCRALSSPTICRFIPAHCQSLWQGIKSEPPVPF